MTKKPKTFSHCQRCGKEIPESRRSDAKFCKDSCKDAEEKKRYCESHPEYVKRQRIATAEWRHMKEHGHLNFLNDPSQNRKDKYRAARALGYRSGLEVKVAQQLRDLGVAFEYEQLKIKYTIPESVHTYTPDIVLPNGIIIETKGRFLLSDRKKHVLIKGQMPHLDIRFVFMNSAAKLNKGSKTTYADWCDKQGFVYADKLIPELWIKEKGSSNVRVAKEKAKKEPTRRKRSG